jgi:hypothetical protein
MMTAEFAAKPARSRLSPGDAGWNDRIRLIAYRSRDSPTLWHKPNRRKTHDCLMKAAAKFAAP